MYFSTFDLLHILSVAVQVPLIVALLYKGKRPLSNQLMAVFFFSQVLNSLSILCWSHFDDSYSRYPYLAYLAVPFYAVWGPAMYLYIQAETSRAFKPKPLHLLHFLPFLGCSLYFIFAFHLHNLPEKAEMLRSGEVYGRSLRQFYSAFIALQVFCYNVLAIIRLERYGRDQPLKSGAMLRRFRWNRFILYGYFVACICNNIASWIYPLEGTAQLSYYFYISVSLFLVYFSVILTGALLGSHFADPPRQPGAASLNKALAASLQQRLPAYMLTEKPYLKFNLTISELAEYLNFKDRHLSEYINTYYATTFQDYVNRFRIEEAKELLNKDIASGQTILEVAYASGFSSKSAFNAAFRKHTLTTPTAFRKRCLAKKT